MLAIAGFALSTSVMVSYFKRPVTLGAADSRLQPPRYEQIRLLAVHILFVGVSSILLSGISKSSFPFNDGKFIWGGMLGTACYLSTSITARSSGGWVQNAGQRRKLMNALWLTACAAWLCFSLSFGTSILSAQCLMHLYDLMKRDRLRDRNQEDRVFLPI